MCPLYIPPPPPLPPGTPLEIRMRALRQQRKEEREGSVFFWTALIGTFSLGLLALVLVLGPLLVSNILGWGCAAAFFFYSLYRLVDYFYPPISEDKDET